MSLGTPSPAGAPPQREDAPPKRGLQKISDIELAGQKLHLAKNGGFHLVKPCIDVYGNPSGTELTIHQWLGQEKPLDQGAMERVQALLDAYGEALVRLRGLRDLRLGGGESGEP